MRPLQQLPNHTTIVQWQNKSDLKIDKATDRTHKQNLNQTRELSAPAALLLLLVAIVVAVTVVAGFNFETIANWQSKSSKTVETAAAAEPWNKRNETAKRAKNSQHGIFSNAFYVPMCACAVRLCVHGCVCVCDAKAFDLNWVCENFRWFDWSN